MRVLLFFKDKMVFFSSQIKRETKKTMTKLLFGLCAIVYLFLNGQLYAQSDSLESEIVLRTLLDNDNVPLNEEVVYHVELSWNGDLDRYKIGDISDPAISNLTLRGSGSSNRISTDENGNPKSIKSLTYYFKPLEIGMAYIDGLTIEYIDQRTNKGEILLAQRLGVKISEATIKAKEEFIPGTVMLWILFISFILIALYFILRYIQRRKSVQDEEVIVLSIEEKYLELLKDTIHLSNNDSKQNMSDMVKLLNSYVAERFSIPGNVEFSIVKDRLEKIKIAKEYLLKVEEMYGKAELARFAGETVELAELHLYYDSIEKILNECNEYEKSNLVDKENK